MRIFEEAAFALSEPPEGGVEQIDAERVISGAVDFNGPFSGTLVMVTSKDLAATVAANMLGVDECEAGAEVTPKDALGEILNMICGNLLPAIAGSGPEFRIEAPREIAAADATSLMADWPEDYKIAAKLCIEGSPAEIALLVSN